MLYLISEALRKGIFNEYTYTIHKLSSQMGLTSRTLRHWESEGLFYSMRDSDSGWRVYDETAVLSIRITVLLRQLDIPIKEIKTVLDNKTYDCLSHVIQNQISVLKAYNRENVDKEKRLIQFLSAFEKQENKAIMDSFLSKLLKWAFSAQLQIVCIINIFYEFKS